MLKISLGTFFYRPFRISEVHKTCQIFRKDSPFLFVEINFYFPWLQKILDERLNNRVDSMVSAGLVKELLDFHARYNEERVKTNT